MDENQPAHGKDTDIGASVLAVGDDGDDGEDTGEGMGKGVEGEKRDAEIEMEKREVGLSIKV